MQNNKKNTEELKERYLKLRQETPHKVIGWFDQVNDRKAAEDSNNLYLAALLNDISENCYDFSGDEMYLFPVFEDNTYLDFSSRGWGDVLAKSRNEFEELSYDAYAFMYKGKKYPDKGFYRNEKIIVNVSDKVMEELHKYLDNFFEQDDEFFKKWYGANYLYDITDIDFKNKDAIKEVEFVSKNNKAIYDVAEVKYLDSVEELNKLIAYCASEESFSFPELVVGDLDTLRNKLTKEKRIVLLLRNL